MDQETQLFFFIGWEIRGNIHTDILKEIKADLDELFVIFIMKHFRSCSSVDFLGVFNLYAVRLNIYCRIFLNLCTSFVHFFYFLLD